MHENVPVRFGRGRLDSLGYKGLAAYLIAGDLGLRASSRGPEQKTLRREFTSAWRTDAR